MTGNHGDATAEPVVQNDVSAGGVVIRCTPDGIVEVVLCGRMDPPRWHLPKGTPEDGERLEETALREVQEETGLQVRILGLLGEVHYSFTRDGARHDKRVVHYLLEPVGGSVEEHDHEFDTVRWFTLNDEAESLLAHETDGDVLHRARNALSV